MPKLIEVQNDLSEALKRIERNKAEAFDPSTLFMTQKNTDGSESLAINIPEDEDEKDQGFDSSKLKLVNDEEVKIHEQDFEDSTALDAFVGNLDKVSATAALMLGVWGAIDVEDAATFSAAHSLKLHNAQKHAPEYMQEVMRALDKTEGFVSTVAVLAKFPKTLPRLLFEQTGNSVFPIAMRIGGGVAGGFAIPVIGAFAGMLVGAYAGNAFQETAFWIDQIMQERGVDPTDAKQVLAFLRNKELMDGLAAEAARKGLSQAAVATIFDLFTGRILTGAGKTLSSKALRFTGGVATQGVSEPTEEIAGQLAARGRFSEKDAALEFVLGLGGNVVTTATISLFNQATGKESFIRVKDAGKEAVSEKESKEVSKSESKTEAKKGDEQERVEKAVPGEEKSKVNKVLERMMKKLKSESQGQQILDELEQSDTSPKEVVSNFWKNTWSFLDDKQKKLITDNIEANTSFKPGDTIGFDKHNKPIVAETWEDVADLIEFGENIEELEGLQRGLISLMEFANRAVEKIVSREEKEIEGFLSTKQQIFHGTHVEIGVFTPREVKNINSMGTWFTSSEEKARELYGPKVFSVDKPEVNFIVFEGEEGSDFDEVLGRNAQIAREVGFTKEADILESNPTSKEKKDIARTLLLSKEYVLALRNFLESNGFEGILWKNSTIDISKGEKHHDVFLIFNKEDIPLAESKTEAKKGDEQERVEKAVSKEEEQLVVANMGADGIIYFGEPGDTHGDLSLKFAKQIRDKLNLKPGEPTFTEIGFAFLGDKKILSRKEAFKLTEFKQTSIEKGQLDAGDLKDKGGFKREKETLTDAEVIAEAKLPLEQREKKQKARAETKKKVSAKKTEDAHIKNIEADAEPFKVKGAISPHEKEIAGGLTGNEEFNNVVATASNGFKAKMLALTPMDVVFDLMSKVTGTFKGAVITTFKKPLDIGQRNQTKHDLKIKNEYIEIRDKLNLNDERSKDRIGVWGAITQEGGRERILAQLEASGVDAEKVLTKFETEGLTKEETKMFEFMRVNFEKLKQPVLEVMKEAYGKDFRFVKEYFPFMADFKAMEDSEIQEMFGADAKLVELVQPDVRAKPPGKVQQGFTRERVGGELNIKIDAEKIFLKYVDDATYLIHMGRDIERLRKLAKRKEFKAAVGTLGSDITKNWLDLMARRGGAQGSRITKLDWLRKNVGVAILGFKLATVMIQTTAIFDGAVRLGPITFKGMQNIIVDPEWRAFIRDNFTEVQNRVGGDASIRELQDANFGPVINKLRDVSVLGIRTIDGLVASGIAAAAYEKIVTEKGNKVDFANPDIDAIIEAELEVRLTQGSGLFKDVPAALSDGAFWGNASLDKAFFQFQTFVLSRWGLVTTAFGGSDKWHEPTALKVRLVSFLALALIAETGLRMGAEAIIAGAAGAVSGDDPVEKALDSFIEDPFFEKLALNAVQLPPILGSIVSTAIYGNAPIPVISLPVEAGRRFGFAWGAKTTDKKFLNLVRGVNLLAGILGVAPGAVQVDQLLREIIKKDKKTNTNRRTRSRRTRTRSR